MLLMWQGWNIDTWCVYLFCLSLLGVINNPTTSYPRVRAQYYSVKGYNLWYGHKIRSYDILSMSNIIVLYARSIIWGPSDTVWYLCQYMLFVIVNILFRKMIFRIVHLVLYFYTCSVQYSMIVVQYDSTWYLPGHPKQ